VNDATAILLGHAPPPVKQQWASRIQWRLGAHQFQIPPDGPWRGWMLKAGRGAGKTRTGAQDAVEYCLDHKEARYAIIAPTQSDVRATCFEGESGVRSVLWAMGIEADWQPSRLELRLGNGSTMFGYSAEKPDRLRGPQFHRAWCDELAAWRDAPLGDALGTTFNNLNMGLRLGDDARMIITTTPKRVALVRDLMDRPDYVVTSGTTYDNIHNLSERFALEVRRYEGTTIGRQELLGELLDEVEGALWKREVIDRFRLKDAGDMARVVVGVDPQGSVTTGTTGIVAAGITRGNCLCGRRDNLPHGYVLADRSLSAMPDGWARAAIDLFHGVKADRLIAERNFGGDMVEATLRTIWSSAPVDMVTASRGKQQRAEPIAALYEQGRIHHIGGLSDLEDEMTAWTPDDSWSPNRLDALVWALTALGLSEWREAKIHTRQVAQARI
jgi:phage terminase large subunit-like protein